MNTDKGYVLENVRLLAEKYDNYDEEVMPIIRAYLKWTSDEPMNFSENEYCEHAKKALQKWDRMP